ncbi:MAG TPA: hypothetical protein PLK94_11925 [Alphaproteobacteria bacterium]|nr:hypothetical protein [Alphaproteobacteria bacterium]HOO51987.1 hypothetical protein [Alphaproteobacteria bacterium]
MKHIKTNIKGTLLGIIALLIMGILGTPFAKAETAISSEIANNFYQQCQINSRKEGTMSESSIMAYCECTSKTMKQNMSVEDLVAMKGEDQAARNAINKVITDVNGPCMAVPLHDKVYNKCMMDVSNKKVCECLSTGIALEISDKTQTMMKELLQKNPNMFDPMGELMEMPEYKQAEKTITMGCITTNF